MDLAVIENRSQEPDTILRHLLVSTPQFDAASPMPA